MKKHTLTNKRNFLKRVRQVQATYQERYAEGLPTAFIHRKWIEPQYNISLATLRRYLSISVSAEEKRLAQS